MAELLERLKSQGVEAEEVSYPFLTEQILLIAAIGAASYWRVRGGLFYIQDPHFSVRALSRSPANRCWTCITPGGKTYIAQRMKNQGNFVAVDIESGWVIRKT